MPNVFLDINFNWTKLNDDKLLRLSVMIVRLAALVTFPTLCSHAQIYQRIREAYSTPSNQTQVCESLWQFNAILWELCLEKYRNYRPTLYVRKTCENLIMIGVI